ARSTAARRFSRAIAAASGAASSSRSLPNTASCPLISSSSPASPRSTLAVTSCRFSWAVRQPASARTTRAWASWADRYSSSILKRAPAKTQSLCFSKAALLTSATTRLIPSLLNLGEGQMVCCRLRHQLALISWLCQLKLGLRLPEKVVPWAVDLEKDNPPAVSNRVLSREKLWLRRRRLPLSSIPRR